MLEGDEPDVEDDSLVCTTGTVTLWPGASNVIAGAANFSIDIRSAPSSAPEAARLQGLLHSLRLL